MLWIYVSENDLILGVRSTYLMCLVSYFGFYHTSRHSENNSSSGGNNTMLIAMMMMNCLKKILEA